MKAVHGSAGTLCVCRVNMQFSPVSARAFASRPQSRFFDARTLKFTIGRRGEFSFGLPCAVTDLIQREQESADDHEQP